VGAEPQDPRAIEAKAGKYAQDERKEARCWVEDRKVETSDRVNRFGLLGRFGIVMHRWR
jgi:hypothetical protein